MESTSPPASPRLQRDIDAKKAFAMRTFSRQPALMAADTESMPNPWSFIPKEFKVNDVDPRPDIDSFYDAIARGWYGKQGGDEYSFKQAEIHRKLRAACVDANDRAGDLERDSKSICQTFHIKLHIIEVGDEGLDDKHYLIDSNGILEKNSGEIDWKEKEDETIIHILKKGNSFASITLEEKEVDAYVLFKELSDIQVDFLKAKGKLANVKHTDINYAVTKKLYDDAKTRCETAVRRATNLMTLFQSLPTGCDFKFFPVDAESFRVEISKEKPYNANTKEGSYKAVKLAVYAILISFVFASMVGQGAAAWVQAYAGGIPNNATAAPNSTAAFMEYGMRMAEIFAKVANGTYTPTAEDLAFGSFVGLGAFLGKFLLIVGVSLITYAAMTADFHYFLKNYDKVFEKYKNMLKHGTWDMNDVFKALGAFTIKSLPGIFFALLVYVALGAFSDTVNFYHLTGFFLAINEGFQYGGIFKNYAAVGAYVGNYLSVEPILRMTQAGVYKTMWDFTRAIQSRNAREIVIQSTGVAFILGSTGALAKGLFNFLPLGIDMANASGDFKYVLGGAALAYIQILLLFSCINVFGPIGRDLIDIPTSLSLTRNPDPNHKKILGLCAGYDLTSSYNWNALTDINGITGMPKPEDKRFSLPAQLTINAGVGAFALALAYLGAYPNYFQLIYVGEAGAYNTTTAFGTSMTIEIFMMFYLMRALTEGGINLTAAGINKIGQLFNAIRNSQCCKPKQKNVYDQLGDKIEDVTDELEKGKPTEEQATQGETVALVSQKQTYKGGRGCPSLGRCWTRMWAKICGPSEDSEPEKVFGQGAPAYQRQ
ncbi:MAG TPA: hypothetical protein VGV92_01090 [Gammaproteobacteria bacterium]|nr:hypothetical protein [Gammaproteobacteria bacterium]